MPFTFSHPALIIPLLRSRQRFPWLSATGLTTGSMAPDCEKFLRLHLASSHSHTLGSVFYFSCPVALVLAFAFHLLVRQPLLMHLPPVLYRRLGRFTSVDWVGYFRRYYWGVIWSIVVGALLHLFWDSFTHPSPQLEAVFPILPRLVGVGEEQRTFFFWVTMLNSALGGAAICWAVWRMPVRYHGPVPTTAAVVRYWSIVGLTTGVLTAEWLLVMDPEFVDGSIAAISAGLFGIVVASLYTQYAQRRLLYR